MQNPNSPEVIFEFAGAKNVQMSEQFIEDIEDTCERTPQISYIGDHDTNHPTLLIRVVAESEDHYMRLIELKEYIENYHPQQKMLPPRRRILRELAIPLKSQHRMPYIITGYGFAYQCGEWDALHGFKPTAREWSNKTDNQGYCEGWNNGVRMINDARNKNRN